MRRNARRRRTAPGAVCRLARLVGTASTVHGARWKRSPRRKLAGLVGGTPSDAYFFSASSLALCFTCSSSWRSRWTSCCRAAMACCVFSSFSTLVSHSPAKPSSLVDRSCQNYLRAVGTDYSREPAASRRIFSRTLLAKNRLRFGEEWEQFVAWKFTAAALAAAEHCRWKGSMGAEYRNRTAWDFPERTRNGANRHGCFVTKYGR